MESEVCFAMHNCYSDSDLTQRKMKAGQVIVIGTAQCNIVHTFSMLKGDC